MASVFLALPALTRLLRPLLLIHDIQVLLAKVYPTRMVSVFLELPALTLLLRLLLLNLIHDVQFQRSQPGQRARRRHLHPNSPLFSSCSKSFTTSKCSWPRCTHQGRRSVITFGSIDDPSAPISSSPAAAPPIKSEGVKLSHPVPYTPPQPGMSSVSSPPPTPSTASLPTTRLNINSNAFVPTGRAKITLKSADGQQVKLEKLTKTNPSSATTPLPVFRPGTPTRRRTRIRLETEDQRRKRLAEEEEKEQEKIRAKAQADEKVKPEKTPSSATTALPPQGSVYRQGSPGTPTRRPTSIRMETEDQRRKRLAEEEKKEQEKTRAKAEADEKVKLEKTPSSATTALPPQGSACGQGSLGTPTWRPTSIRMETEDQRRQRLAEEEEKEQEKTRAKAEADEKFKLEKTPSSATTALPPQGSVYRQGSLWTPTWRPTSIRMETEDQRRKRLAEEDEK
ncbi:uncharacterized protein LACBIDRAFT_325162 [Laccaria bicolor S238N-H82]|uniref:Predicted protein n=1 Tax=Laccaria bicolor (strain S238N-H82 / ATCC MYA-4686) TaxID=486041 RepID=B0D416_LACBS|nr:uncharacterized protein LACBIDRAFT_325162 [Laccaria bicolor S238N-H82]EDR10498.1 predicted protein [Laccaria bicolor S238N-H82]|eukprot:XP_001878948.1 predicted protein [Laccaria bicolor S238N-H82]